jgi:hypothetical protein
VRLPEACSQRIYAGEAPLKVRREFRCLPKTDVRRDTGIRLKRREKLERGGAADAPGDL